MDNETLQPHSNYREIHLRAGEELIGTLEGLEIGDDAAIVFSLAKHRYLKVVIDPSQVDLLKKDLDELVGQKVGVMKTGIKGSGFLVRKIQVGRKKRG